MGLGCKNQSVCGTLVIFLSRVCKHPVDSELFLGEHFTKSIGGVLGHFRRVFGMPGMKVMHSEMKQDTGKTLRYKAQYISNLAHF